MNEPFNWRIPTSTFRWLSECPQDRPVVMLVRHSVRHDLPPDDAGNMLPITEVGAQLAVELGGLLEGRLRSLHASPILRCIQTAEAIRAGANVEVPVQKDRWLGDPGIYVVDGRRAWPEWQKRGHEGVMEHLVCGTGVLPGLADPDAAARFLVLHMLTAAGAQPGIHVFVTHDSIITATAARLLGVRLGTEVWPWYLEAAFFWQNDARVHTVYRDWEGDRAAPLCTLAEKDVIEFARREIALTIGLTCPARFFMAGGAFRALLTGRPPRDLDLWAPSERDRELLLEAISQQGGRSLERRPFADAFQLNDRVIEVPDRVEPTTLEERLCRFDLALSAIGVEHLSGDRWRAYVHPLAQVSVARREVLLLKPLVNWKYALATLDRARRYAEDLSYHVPVEEENEVWGIFESQPSDGRAGMLVRYDRTVHCDHGVREEALCRL